MIVYRISGDSDYFGSAYEDVTQRRLIVESDRENRQMPTDIDLVSSYHFDDLVRGPVLTDFGGAGYETTLVLRRPRTDVLRPMLEQAGTILPMTPWLGESFEAFICEARIDAIDEGRMEYYPDDHPMFDNLIRRYAFKADLLRDATLFRVTGFLARLFATDRFLDLVQAHDLTGLQVLPLWSSETGPIGFVEDPMMEFERYPPGFGSTPQGKRAAMRAILARRGDAPTA